MHTAKRMTACCILCVLAALACAGCAKHPADGDTVVATVSSKPITLKQFNAKIAKLPPYYRSIVEKNRKLYLDDMIIEQLFYEEAVRKGVNSDPEVLDLVNEAKRKILISKYIQNEIEQKVRVSDLEIKEYYDSNKDDFKTPALWRASHILVGTEAEAAAVRDEIVKGAVFEELARKYSIDATANRGGDIGFFRIGQLIPDFEKAALKLKIGEMSGIVHTQFGYHLIKLTDRREPVAEAFEKVRSAIEGELKKKKRESAMNTLVLDLKSRYNVIVEKDAFKAAMGAPDETEGPETQTQSPAPPGGEASAAEAAHR